MVALIETISCAALRRVNLPRPALRQAAIEKTKAQGRGFLFLSAGHARQCVGFTLIHLLVSAAIYPPTIRRQGNATACGPFFSMIANSRSPAYSAVAIGFQSMSVARCLERFFALGRSPKTAPVVGFT